MVFVLNYCNQDSSFDKLATFSLNDRCTFVYTTQYFEGIRINVYVVDLIS